MQELENKLNEIDTLVDRATNIDQLVLCNESYREIQKQIDKLKEHMIASYILLSNKIDKVKFYGGLK